MEKRVIRVEDEKRHVRVPLPLQRPATFRDRTKFHRPSWKKATDDW